MVPQKLDITQKQPVQYCIPLWLRDEQIQQNIKAVKGRVEPGERTEEPIAVVCFGPSLNQTWEQVKDFKVVISCSGAHKFLVDRGITPTYHVEVDPRAHKIGLMGDPQKETTYLLASAVSPKLIEHLKGFNVKLWHVFDATDEGIRKIPAGEWAITGGCDVGLRALTVAAFLGYRNLHIFGMDQSAGTIGNPTDTRHAAFHPNSGVSSKYSTVEYDGVEYYTTIGMLEAARSVKHELEMMPAVKPTFYGEGLVQHMMKGFVAKEDDAAKMGAIAISKPILISDEYAALNEKLHQDNLAYGVGGGKHADTVLKLCDRLKTTSVLDYGCGKGYLGKALPFPIWEYDPAIDGKKDSPRPADIVVCTDVLEHIEPEHLPAVIADLHRCTKKIGFFTVHTKAAQKFLADGRNAHLIQEGKEWWSNRLGLMFTIGRVYEVGVELWFVLEPKILKRSV